MTNKKLVVHKKLVVPAEAGTDAEIEKKFKAEARQVMDSDLTDKIIKTVWTLEQVSDMGSFTRLFAS